MQSRCSCARILPLHLIILAPKMAFVLDFFFLHCNPCLQNVCALPQFFGLGNFLEDKDTLVVILVATKKFIPYTTGSHFSFPCFTSKTVTDRSCFCKSWWKLWLSYLSAVLCIFSVCCCTCGSNLCQDREQHCHPGSSLQRQVHTAARTVDKAGP